MDPISLRMIERILSTLIGGFSIFLGFYLFKIVPHIDSGEGKFTFPGGSIHLMRTGPGVFLALFGAFIIFCSFYFQVKYSPEKLSAENQKNQKGGSFQGLSSEDLRTYEIWIENLNRINSSIKSERLFKEKETASNTIEQVKLVLLQQILDDPRDPDFEEFKLKVLADPKQEFRGKWQNWADIYNKQ